MAGTNRRTAPLPTTTDAIRRALVGANPRRTAIRSVVLVAIAYIVFGHLLTPVRGAGPSMLPTLEDGQLVLINRLAYWRRDPQRGDVVALSLAGPNVLYIKRIVGMPGERVRIESGTVMINGAPLQEPYVEQRRPWQVAEAVLGPDEYLVIGDNRGMPQQSHDFGKTRRERVVGRVISW
jgi:signal peptidase I